MPKLPPSHNKVAVNIELNATEAMLGVVHTEAQLTKIRRVLRMTIGTGPHNSLKWDTTSRIAKSLRYQLNLRSMWVNFRTKFLATSKLLDRVTSVVKSSVIDASYGNDLSFCPHRVDKNYNRPIPALNFQAGLPTPEQFAKAWRVHKQWFELCLAVDVFWEQSKELLALPDWKLIKPLCPVNGRPAYSMLLALATGRPERVNPNHNSLFGWCGDARYRGSRTGDESISGKLKIISRMISSRRKEAAGPAPSVTTGRQLLNSEVYPQHEPFQWKPSEVSARRSYLISRHSQQIRERTLCGDTSHCTPRMLKHLHQATSKASKDNNKLDIWHRIVLKVMQLPQDTEVASFQVPQVCRTRPENQVLTALTGPVVHIIGGDYYAPVIYASRERTSNWQREGKVVTTYGYILLRQGWPDMVHCTEAEFITLRVGGEPGNQPGTASLTRRLDTSSASYFDRIREEKERKLTTNQRYARMLKNLRSIFLPITKDDSYQSGNCRPGTASFVDTVKAYTKVPLEDQTAEISGRELARCWRASKYVQPDRLNSVIKYMLNKQSIQIQLGHDSLDALFPGLFRALVEFKCQFPVETIEADEPDHQPFAYVTTSDMPQQEYAWDERGFPISPVPLAMGMPAYGPAARMHSGVGVAAVVTEGETDATMVIHSIADSLSTS